MKKILSIVLCLAIVFSVCSLGLTANAADGDDSCKVSYSFNNGGIFVEFHIIVRNYIYPKYYVNVYKDHTVNEYYRRITQVVDVPGTFDLEGIFEEFLPECDLLERIDDYFGHNSSSLSTHFTVSEYFAQKTNSLCFYDYFNEDDVAYIISKLNPNKLNYVTFNNRGIEDMSPIVDALLGCCQNSLQSFSIYGDSNFTEIDERIFTDFPNMQGINLDGVLGCFEYDDNIRISEGPYNQLRFYFYLTIEDAFDVWDSEGKYHGDEGDYMLDCYNERILPHFVGQENVIVRPVSYYGNFRVEHFYSCNGMTVHLGKDIDGYVVYEGDVTGDQYVDSFDVATATEYVNTFEEPEDEAVMMAMDVVADGYIDATDLAFISYIANFEG